MQQQQQQQQGWSRGPFLLSGHLPIVLEGIHKVLQVRPRGPGSCSHLHIKVLGFCSAAVYLYLGCSSHLARVGR